jgi:purine-binding chemotaxis protein CheW
MVDLVKIRKKAKKVAGDRLPETVAGSQLPVAEGASSETEAASPAQESVSSLHALPSTVHRPPSTDSGHRPPSTETKLDRFKSGAGRRVVMETVTAGETAADIAELELLTFIIAGEQYAVDIERIVEIVTPRPITRVPNADASIVGIISLRGAIVTLVDVRGKLHHPTGTTSAPDPRVVVIEQFGETVGFQVDRVVRVIKMNRGAVEPHPVVHASEHDEAVQGVFRQGNALTILLDLDKLLGARALPGPVA